MMKIEQYHYDAMDRTTMDWLQDMTGTIQGTIDERLVRIYWTYKAHRDAWDRGNQMTWQEWRYLCMRLGIYVGKDRLDQEIVDYIATLTNEVEKPDQGLVDATILIMAFSDAAARSDNWKLLSIQYEAALAGLIPPPDYIRNTLADWEMRWRDLEERRIERERPSAAPPPAPTPEPEPEPEPDTDNGRMAVLAAEDVPDSEYRVPVEIDYYGRIRQGRFTGMDGGRLTFIEDGTRKRFRLKNVKRKLL